MRVIATALAICAVSFAVDVAGDLAVGERHAAADTAQAASARVELPPYLVGAAHAHPLPARQHVRHHRPRTEQTAMALRAQKPHAHSVKSLPKTPPERAPKPFPAISSALKA
ncbi:MAG TPA: hypothetical protein VG943_09595 [Caulobacterales bacterium]|nr:hypothetical protein [Caulobacterales bacterium]